MRGGLLPPRERGREKLVLSVPGMVAKGSTSCANFLLSVPARATGEFDVCISLEQRCVTVQRLHNGEGHGYIPGFRACQMHEA